MPVRSQLDQIKRVPLIENGSAVSRLDRIFPGRNVWIKDDSRLHRICGGNKVRRLEYLLAALKSRHSVLTFGYESSNHVLATAYFCKSLDIPTRFVLMSGPHGMCDTDRETMQLKMGAVRKYASRVSIVDSKPAVVCKAVAALAGGLGRMTMIPPGGSSALGALGSVRAVFELSDQVERGEMPRPEVVFVPIGTGGTAVGLAVGFRALGWTTKVIAVKIALDKLNEPRQLRKIAAGIRRLIPELLPEMVDLGALEIEERFLGEGYGRPSSGGQRAVTKWSDLQGVRLENTYSAKAAAALEERVSTFTGPVLFWLTHGDFRANLL